ncbi:glycosyl hydrolase [Paenibacillus andongensis]|uniref:glycosyl hydrolase n=1 Tax=Paenibacillus andongensis TaxID=2975482 RepID=UPI0021BAE92F|nr:glycosyl hydrolase [Paenibacillus andongensis]
MLKLQGWFAGLLVFILIFTLILPVGAQVTSTSSMPVFSDISGHWAEKDMVVWMSQGLIDGYPDGTFRPDSEITRAEFVTLINKAFNFSLESKQQFADVRPDDWFGKQLLIARGAGYYEGFPNNMADPVSSITRQDAAVLLARVFEMKSASSSDTRFHDASQISEYAKVGVNALSSFINGYEDGAFRPFAPISKAEVLSLLHRLASVILTASGEYASVSVSGNMLLNSDGIVLKDTVIPGDLYLTAGIGNGEVQLERVTVKGRTIIAGGGENTVVFKDSVLHDVNVNRKDGKVRVWLTGKTQVDSIQIESASKLEMSEGTFIRNVDLNSPTDVKISKEAMIANLKVGTEAKGTNITGEGKITEAIFQTDGVTVNGKLMDQGTYKLDGPASPVPSSAGSGNPDSSPSTSTRPVPNHNQPIISTDKFDTSDVNLVDKDATAKTRSLFAYLQGLRGNNILLGQEHATTEGITITKRDGTESDVYNAVGDFPALYGWDTLSLEGKEKPGAASNNREQNRDNLIDVMKKAYERDGVLTLSAHMPNFVTGGSFNDTAGSVVANILPGGSKHAEFNDYLDMIADFANHLKDADGNSIPVIFRPWHENNGSWFWWGAAFTTPSQYKEIYRYTVEYLREQKGVRNFLYAYSPNAHFNENADNYMKTYPGDDYVDIMGFDAYGPLTDAKEWMGKVQQDAKLISQLADIHHKVAALTEFGYNPNGFKFTGNVNKQFFTDLLGALKSDPDAKRMAYMLTWAHFELEKLYLPIRNYQGQDSELLDDFVLYYNDLYSAFNSRLHGVYDLNVQAVQSEQPFMHIVSPTELGKVTADKSTIRAKVLNQTVTKVVYSVLDNPTEFPMQLEASGYYTAHWTPSKVEQVGSNVSFKVKAYAIDGSIMEQTATAKIMEAVLGQYTFDTGIDGVQSNGGWQANITSLEHAVVQDNGMLKLNVEIPDSSQTWQELKLEFPNVTGQVYLPDVNKLKVELMMPIAGNADASIQAVVMLPPNWNDKYGMNKTTKKLSALGTKTVSDVVYGMYSAEIDLDNPAELANATSLALSIVGSGMNYSGPVYVDNIKFIHAYKDLNDPSVVDTFEGYQGNDGSLGEKYQVSSGGDPVQISLDSTNKAAGQYGVKYTYTLGSSGYGGITKNIGGVDWSAFNKLKFWLKPDGSGQKLVIQIKAGGIYFEAYPSISNTTARWVEIPFGQFAPASWESHSDAVLDVNNRKTVQEFSIYVNAVDGAKLRSQLYFDDIHVMQDGSGEGNNGGGGGGGNTPITAGILYDFESDTELWSHSEGVSGVAISDVTAEHGAKSLKVEIPLGTGPKYELFKNAPINMSESTSIKARMKVVYGGTSNAGSGVIGKLYMKTGSGWKWYDSGETVLSADSFTTLTLNLDEASMESLNLVQSVGVELSAPEGSSGTATVYVDYVTAE